MHVHHIVIYIVLPSLESVVRLSIRTREYNSNALMSGGSVELRVLFRRNDALGLYKNRPFWCMLSTWNREGEKSENNNSPVL
jgi:hypothetical protein